MRRHSNAETSLVLRDSRGALPRRLRRTDRPDTALAGAICWSAPQRLARFGAMYWTLWHSKGELALRVLVSPYKKRAHPHSLLPFFSSHTSQA